MNGSYLIQSYGRAYNPVDWYYNPNYLVGRLYYIVGGTAYYKNDTLLKKGCLYVFGMDNEFRVSQDPADPIDHIFFDFVSFHSYLRAPFREIDLSKNDKLRHLVLALTEEFSDSACPRNVANAYFELIIRELKKVLNSDEHFSPLTEKVLRIIHSYPLGSLSVQGIAHELNVNENHMIRCFRKEMNVTPHSYIGYLKAEEAVKQIKQGKKMQEIADLLGYSSVSSLSYSFKSVTGRNLSDFR